MVSLLISNPNQADNEELSNEVAALKIQLSEEIKKQKDKEAKLDEKEKGKFHTYKSVELDSQRELFLSTKESFDNEKKEYDLNKSEIDR